MSRINLAITKLNGQHTATLVAMSRRQYRRWLNEAGAKDEKIVALISAKGISLEGLLLIMSENESLCGAIEDLMLRTFLEGQAHGREEGRQEAKIKPKKNS